MSENETPIIFAGDIGATNTRLALFPGDAALDATTKTAVEKTFRSRDYADLRNVLREFVAGPATAGIARACFGVAGPIRHRRCVATNLPWTVDADSLAAALRIAPESVLLINDLEANAYGIAALAPRDFLTLSEGAAGAQGNAALVSAGTGLGEAGLFWDGRRHHPFACEGGHTSFAPTNSLQLDLLAWLLKKYSHVSWERVLSGPGLVNLYGFLRDTGRGDEPAWLAAQMKNGDPAPVISRNALDGKSSLCEKALDLFVELYGAEAGNVALKLLATGGVYIGGGIAPKILPKLQAPAFREAFLAKGRMRPLLETMPLRIILNERAALLGAARRAMMDS